MCLPIMRAAHYNGSLTSTDPVQIDVSKLCLGIHIRNTGSNVLDISFDGGVNFYTIAAAAEFVEKVRFTSFWVRAPSGNTGYTAVILCG